MGYFVWVSGLVLLGLLSVGAVVGRSNVAIGQPVEAKPVDLQQSSEDDVLRSSEADRLIDQGNQQIDTSQYEAAQQSYVQALEIYRKFKNRNGEAGALMGLGITYQSLSQYDKAIGYYQQALPIYQQVKDRNSEANALNNLGVAYRSLSQYDKAIGYYQQALPIHQQFKNRTGEADTLTNLGNAHRSLSQYDKAIGYHQQALPIFQQVKDRNGEADTLVNLGNAYRSLSQYEQAIAFYKQSVNVSESIRHGIRQLPQDSQKAYVKSIADTYTYLAELLTKQGRSTEAQAVLALLDRVPPNNADGIPLTPAEQKILAEFAK
jgi:tetratricopeptide (TPR) repeat protein